MSNKWNDTCQSWKKKWSNEYFGPGLHNNIINFYEVIDLLNKNTKKDQHIIMADAGSPSYAMPQSFYSNGVKCVYSPSQADMGCALPASIGVALAAPHKKVIAVIGDGSFMSNLQELSTIKYHNLKIILIIINNNGYLSIKNTQNKFFDGRVSGTSRLDGVAIPAAFNKIAFAFDFNYQLILSKSDLKTVPMTIDFADSPTIIEILTNPQEEVIPAQGMRDGKQMPLDNMYPYINDEEYKEEMLRCM